MSTKPGEECALLPSHEGAWTCVRDSRNTLRCRGLRYGGIFVRVYRHAELPGRSRTPRKTNVTPTCCRPPHAIKRAVDAFPRPPRAETHCPCVHSRTTVLLFPRNMLDLHIYHVMNRGGRAHHVSSRWLGSRSAPTV